VSPTREKKLKGRCEGKNGVLDRGPAYVGSRPINKGKAQAPVHNSATICTKEAGKEEENTKY